MKNDVESMNNDNQNGYQQKGHLVPLGMFGKLFSSPQKVDKKRLRKRSLRIEELENREMLDAGLMSALEDMFTPVSYSESETVIVESLPTSNGNTVADSQAAPPTQAAAPLSGYNEDDWNKLVNAGLSEAQITNESIAEWENIGGTQRLIAFTPDYGNTAGFVGITGILDLSGLTALRNVNLSQCALTEVNVSGCTVLETIRSANDNPGSLNNLSGDPVHLQTLNAAGCSALKSLVVASNAITTINVTDCSALETLSCLEDGNLTTLTGLEDCGSLKEIKLAHTNLTTLNLSDHIALERVDLTNNASLTTLSVNGCTALNSLRCTTGVLTGLNVSNLANLTEIDVSNNQLQELSAAGCSQLIQYRADNNKLTELNFTGCTSLQDVSVNGNQLTFSDLPLSVDYDFYFSNQAPMDVLVAGQTTVDLSSEYLGGVSQFEWYDGGNMPITPATSNNGIFTFSEPLSDGAYFVITNSNYPAYPGSTEPGLILANVENPVRTLGYSSHDLEKLRNLGLTAAEAIENPAIATWQTVDEADTANETDRRLLTVDLSGRGRTGALNLENCSYLNSLNCSDNQLTSILVSGTSLTTLNCSNNNLTTLDAHDNTTLVNLQMSGNPSLTSLNVSGCTALTTLSCAGEGEDALGELTNLNITGCTALATLNVPFQQLTALDVTGCNNLATINVPFNKLVGLNLSSVKSSLRHLDCHGNNTLTSLDIGDCANLQSADASDCALTTLTVANSVNLDTLDCSNNSLAALSLSGVDKLVDLDCSENDITVLDLSGKTVLKNLACNANALSTLSVTGLTQLTSLNCSNNSLTTLSTSGQPNLTALDCSENDLTSLDITNCWLLYDLNCSNNDLTAFNVSILNQADDPANLAGLNCSGNHLTSLVVENCSNLSVLDCSNNNLSALSIAGTNLSDLNNASNNLTFATLPKVEGYPGTGKSYTYSPQSSLVIVKEANGTVDLSSQYMEGNTVYAWHRGDDSVIDLSLYTNVGGVFTFESTVSGDIYCVLTHSDFADLELTTNALQIALPKVETPQNVSADVMGVTSDNIALTVGWESVENVSIYRVEYSANADFSESTIESLSVAPNTPSGTEFSLDIDVPANETYYVRVIAQGDGTAYDNSNPSDTITVSLNTDDWEKVSSQQLNSYANWGIDENDEVRLVGINISTSHVLDDPILDLSNCDALKLLACNDQSLTALDISGCTSLESLNCAGNQLTILDVSGLAKLDWISCEYNSLETLDLSGCTALTGLQCQGNNLSELDTALVGSVWCQNNRLPFSQLKSTWNTYSPQNDILIETVPDLGNVVDLTSEYLDEKTSFTWHRSSDDTIIDSTFYDNTDGLFTFSGLGLGDKIYCVMENSDFGSTKLTTVDVEITAPRLPAPSNVTAVPISHDTIDVSWGVVSDASGYRVEWAADDAFTTPLGSEEVTETNFSITGLTVNTSYYVRVTALSDNPNVLTDSSPSAPKESTTLKYVLSQPALGDVTVLSSSEIAAEWSEVTNATGYIVEYSSNNGLSWSSWTESPTLDGTTYSVTITGLSANTTYLVRIAALGGDNYNNSLYSVYEPQTTDKIVLKTPTLNTVTPTGSSSINAVWTGVDNTSTYRVEYSLDEINWEAWTGSPVSGNGITYSAEITDLDAFTEYHVRVTALGFTEYADSTPSEIKSATTEKITLVTPALDDLTVESPNDIGVSWKEVENASGYFVEWSKNENFTDAANKEVTGLETVLDGLDAFTTYYVRVTALGENEYTNSESSAVKSATTNKIVLNPPTLGDLIVEGPYSISVEWEEVTNASGYLVEWSTNEGFVLWPTDEGPTGVESKNVTGTETILDGLDAFTLYYVRVTALGENEYANSVVSVVKSATTEKNILETPTLGDLIVESPHSISTSWGAVENASGYLVEWSINEDFTDAESKNVTGTETVLDELNAFTTYYVRVTALGENGYADSAASGVKSAVTDKIILQAPTLNTLTATDSNTVEVEWTAGENAGGYLVEWSVNEDFADVQNKNVIETTTIIDGLDADTTYYVRVTALGGNELGEENEYADSTASEIKSAHTLLPLPGGTQEPERTMTSVTLTWDAVEGATGYDVQYRAAGSEAWTNWDGTQVVNGTTVSATITNLESGIEYEFQVRAINGENNTSVWKPIPSVTTDSITVNASEPNGVEVAWQEDYTGKRLFQYRTSATGSGAEGDWVTVMGFINQNKTMKITGLAAGNYDFRLLELNTPEAGEDVQYTTISSANGVVVAAGATTASVPQKPKVAADKVSKPTINTITLNITGHKKATAGSNALYMIDIVQIGKDKIPVFTKIAVTAEYLAKNSKQVVIEGLQPEMSYLNGAKTEKDYLQPGLSYKFSVTAYNAVGSASNGKAKPKDIVVNKAVKTAKFSAVLKVKKILASTTADLNWMPSKALIPAGATVSYKVLMFAGTSKTPSELPEDGAIKVTTTTTTAGGTAKIEGLTANTKYKFAVRTVVSIEGAVVESLDAKVSFKTMK